MVVEQALKRLIYIDQPIFSGYSYDEAAPGKLGLVGSRTLLYG